METTLITTVGQYGPLALLSAGLLYVLMRVSLAWIMSIQTIVTAFSEQMAAMSENLRAQTATQQETQLLLQRLIQDVEHIEEANK